MILWLIRCENRKIFSKLFSKALVDSYECLTIFYIVEDK